MSEFWNSKNAAPIQSHHFRVKFGDIESFAVKSVTMPSLEVSSNEYQVGNQVFKYPGVAKWNDVTLTIVDTKHTLQQVMQELRKQNYISADDVFGGGDGIIKTVKGNAGGTFGTGPNQFFIFQAKTFARAQAAADKERSRFMEGAQRVFDFLGVSQPDANKVKPVGSRADPFLPMVQDTAVASNIWSLTNPWIKSINFGTHDYSSDELITMEIVITYDYASVLIDTPIEPENGTDKYR